MSRLIKRWIPTLLFVTLPGLAVLFGYLFPNRLLVLYRGRPTELRDVLIEWAVIIAAFAFALGMFNIARVHGGRALRLRRGWLYSVALLLAMLVSSILPILSLRYEPAAEATRWIFNYVISPLGASLGALVAFTLALAAFRMLRARRSWGTAFFMLVVGVVLLTNTPLTGTERLPLAYIRHEIVSVLGMAGMRGLLLGVVLGTVITALRVLVGSDRPHSEF
ncbi:MAG: hypothetical protein ACE5OS_06955 [Anaerolineae bacterium]